MKTKILIWMPMVLAGLVFSGCEPDSGNKMNPPAVTNAAGDMPLPAMPSVTNLLTTPSVTWHDTNLPPLTNWPVTNFSVMTNQQVK